jgi:4,5-dihydroxyphthalate decarboxylase
LEYVGDKYSAGEIHYRFVQGEFDVAEMSTATLMRAKEKGKRFLALPVFFQRGPRQRNIFFCEGKLKHPGELKGKQIGAFRYGATAVSWARGYLLDEHGIKTTDVGWFVSGKEVFIGNELPVKVERLDPPLPFGQEKPHLAKLLGEGKLGAALVAGDSGYPGLFGGGALPGVMGQVPGVKPLFEDTGEIIRYVKRTQIYPIIHIPIWRPNSSKLFAKRTGWRQNISRTATPRATPKSGTFWATILMHACSLTRTKRVSRR